MALTTILIGSICAVAFGSTGILVKKLVKLKNGNEASIEFLTSNSNSVLTIPLKPKFKKNEQNSKKEEWIEQECERLLLLCKNPIFKTHIKQAGVVNLQLKQGNDVVFEVRI